MVWRNEAMPKRHDCSHFIPVATGELVELLRSDRTLTDEERDAFRALCERVQEAYHREYHPRLRELKASYAPFDPDGEPSVVPLPAAERQRRLNGLLSDLAWLLDRAHFKHLSREEIEPVLATASDWGVKTNVDFRAFDHLSVFVRGETYQKRRRRRWFGLAEPDEVEVPIFERLVLIMKLRPHPRLGKVNTDQVYVKIFKEIPRDDLDMLLPGAQVKLSVLDRSKIGVGFLTGIAMTVYKVFAEALLKVLSDLNNILHLIANADGRVFWGLAGGFFGYGYSTYYNYHQTRQAYNLALTQSLYFQNLDNNAGVLTRLFNEAEEQASRQAILAYFCLWRFAGPEGFTAGELEVALELYLDRYAELAVLCDEGGPLRALQALALAEPAGERWRAVSPARALEVLEAAALAPTAAR
jgi:hypothetical protein